MAFDPNKFLVALLVLSLLGLGTTYTVASGDLTPNVFDLFGNLLVATIFGMVRQEFLFAHLEALMAGAYPQSTLTRSPARRVL